MSMCRNVCSGRQALLVYPHLRHEVRREFMNLEMKKLTELDLMNLQYSSIFRSNGQQVYAWLAELSAWVPAHKNIAEHAWHLNRHLNHAWHTGAHEQNHGAGAVQYDVLMLHAI